MEIFNLKDKLEYLDEVIILEHNEWSNNELDIKKKEKEILDSFDNKYFCKLILLDNDKLIGFISMFEEDLDKRKDLKPWYATMYIKEEYRGKGYSKILNDAILKEAGKRGFDKLYLKTTLKNYYEKFGAIYIEAIDGENLYYINTKKKN